MFSERNYSLNQQIESTYRNTYQRRCTLISTYTAIQQYTKESTPHIEYIGPAVRWSAHTASRDAGL